MMASKKLVLVVDDEPSVCNVLRRILRIEGYRVITAADGETAIHLVKEKNPEVILLDINIPKIDGREVCRRVRASYPATRVIYYSADAELIASFKSKELPGEADAYIAKPGTIKEILSTISRLLPDSR